MIIYVDCDDTLVLWDDEEVDGIMLRSSPYPNTALIEAVDTLIAQTGALVVVWSGGGKEYAQDWADKYVPHWNAAAMDKHECIRLPDIGDICIDDMEIGVRADLYFPGRFITHVEEYLRAISTTEG